MVGLIHDYIISKENPRIPQLNVAINKPYDRVEHYFGSLMCEGSGIFSGIIEKIEQTYGSLINFKLTIHDSRRNDEELSSILGLTHYVMSIEEEKRLIVNDNDVQLIDIDLKKNGLSTFFIDNIQIVDEVKRFYDEHGLGNGFILLTPEECI
ncbi:hypothetical protein [Pseudoalteromonas piscicida]|nr:hypothetical protein [Pseudoalteromonas piscicida]